MSRRFLRFDAFAKIDGPYKSNSALGGVLTLIVALLSIVLVTSELATFLKIHQDYEFLVDQQRHQTLQINMDLTIAMPCEYLRGDVLDASGGFLHLGNGFRMTPVIFHTHGVSYYGKKAASNLNIVKAVAQANKFYADPDLQVSPGDNPARACRVQGSINVQKLAGMLHFTALGHGYNGAHVAHEAINFTHRIDRFSFGISYPGLVNPLDRSLELAESHTDMFQYFISVVPTIYIDKIRTFGEKIILTSQYAVTDYQKVVSQEAGHEGLPGIFIKYEIEPISVRVTASRQSFLHLLTRLSGIVGGLFVSTGMVFSFSKTTLNFASRFLSQPN
ncbi:endoplasmic reticulum vesicle transporter-domain-containing protein [Polychytrium aggregatum]|uniref:endoplasmic reticulum vesicle transporter-domain-containing protein n=1 Tax=Polychytrium aggregatum TaxID=110093 RepID=UPI0022FDE4D7|nr:endoplasmic reticulum vesicle transporter-domain-containing protein [Polychytrium aggregatum]KAI9209862.1 endoplasmic reticulum vesicle transporter-domain-containing protein [Polychytrium aggregatum]